MKYKEVGMGFFGWFDTDIGIFGGQRTNRFHPPGHTWMDFLVYDTAHKARTGADREIGRMELLVQHAKDESEQPVIKKLVNFEIDKALRRNTRKGQPGEGLGRRAIEALSRTIQAEIEILDIKPSAKGFWKKMGVNPTPNRNKIDGVLRPAVKPELDTIPEMAM